MDPKIAEMIERHYRNDAGYCEDCTTSSNGYDAESVEWPCDTAYLLQRMGYAVREDPPFVYQAPDPNAPTTAGHFIPTIWSSEMAERFAEPGLFSRLVEEKLDTMSVSGRWDDMLALPRELEN